MNKSPPYYYNSKPNLCKTALRLSPDTCDLFDGSTFFVALGNLLFRTPTDDEPDAEEYWRDKLDWKMERIERQEEEMRRRNEEWYERQKEGGVNAI